mmetsp:Transcript_60923/g.131411  ORF Transcript_60923/g.131411 Transcript_60923/m.131411 type:complete len:246 (-) Transcript_60923:827-1564(-)
MKMWQRHSIVVVKTIVSAFSFALSTFLSSVLAAFGLIVVTPVVTPVVPLTSASVLSFPTVTLKTFALVILPALEPCSISLVSALESAFASILTLSFSSITSTVPWRFNVRLQRHSHDGADACCKHLETLISCFLFRHSALADDELNGPQMGHLRRRLSGDRHTSLLLELLKHRKFFADHPSKNWLGDHEANSPFIVFSRSSHGNQRNGLCRCRWSPMHINRTQGRHPLCLGHTIFHVLHRNTLGA